MKHNMKDDDGDEKTCPECGGPMPCPEHSKTGKVAHDVAKKITNMKGKKNDTKRT